MTPESLRHKESQERKSDKRGQRPAELLCRPRDAWHCWAEDSSPGRGGPRPGPVGGAQEELRQQVSTVRKEAGSWLFEGASGQNKDLCVKADSKVHQLELQESVKASLCKAALQ